MSDQNTALRANGLPTGEWKPMDTAPSDRPVICGKWDLFMNKMEWRTASHIAWETTWLGRRRKDYGAREYTHWQELPPPPSGRTPAEGS
jgi:hypothetical protein